MLAVLKGEYRSASALRWHWILNSVSHAVPLQAIRRHWEQGWDARRQILTMSLTSGEYWLKILRELG